MKNLLDGRHEGLGNVAACGGVHKFQLGVVVWRERLVVVVVERRKWVGGME